MVLQGAMPRRFGKGMGQDRQGLTSPRAKRADGNSGWEGAPTCPGVYSDSSSARAFPNSGFIPT